jgi:microcystin-dependent protein
MPATTARLGLPYPVLGDSADISQAVQPLAAALDPVSGPYMAQISTGTSLPNQPVVAGRFFLHTPSATLYVSSGSAWIEIVSGGGAMPIGSMADYGGTTDPIDASGAQRWAICDGRVMSQSAYPLLYSVIGNTWDTVDNTAPGAGNFRLPKTGGRIPLPAGAGTGLTTRSRGAISGAETIALPAHTHTGATPDHLHLTTTPDHLHDSSPLYTGNHNHSVNINTSAPINDVGSASGTAFTRAGGAHQHNVSGVVSTAGNLGVYGTTGAADRSLAAWSTGADRSLAFTTSPPSAALIDKMPPTIVLGPKIIRIK